MSSASRRSTAALAPIGLTTAVLLALTAPQAASASTAPPTAAPQPAIRQTPIPFPAKRKREMAAYAERHYGTRTYHLREPKVIVEHYTGTSTARAAFNAFARDRRDPELHELPGTCVHFVIARDGTIFQLVPFELMCRHTVGLNDSAIGIEHVGFSDREILTNRAQLDASLALTRWLRCRFDIAVEDVIGHNESLSSRYHHERVARLRTQTHEDWRKADMDVYRGRLRSPPY